jgi:Fe-S cluster assembly protein SufD
LDEASVAFEQDIQETITKITPNDSKSLWWLNGAFFAKGVFIKVDKGVVVTPTIHVVHVTTAVDHDTLLLPRCFISIGENAQAGILESHVGFEDVDYFSNAVTDIKMAAHAQLSYCKAECESPKAVSITQTRVWQETQSNLELFSFAHGASLVRNNLSVLLKGEGCNTIMNGFYAIDGSQHVDNHTLLDIQQPNCTSYQLYKGILNDSSRAVFNGKIYVHSIAQKTNGYQLNKHLLLGKSARVDTKPQLEIFADDVKCTHGATIGQLSEDDVFYLQSRCIPKATAIALLSKGFMEDIINTIKSESVRDKLHKLLIKKFPDVKI